MPARPLQQASFAVVDVETTGFYPATDRVLEVAIETIDLGGNVLDRFTTLVNPHRDVGATRVHRITSHMVAEAPEFSHVAGEILRRLSDRVLVGHNVSFDLRFLKAEFERLGYQLPELPAVCTLALSRWWGPDAPSHQLGPACEAVGIGGVADHSAAGDAHAAAGLFVALLRTSRAAQRCQTLGDLYSCCTGHRCRRVPRLDNPFPGTCSLLPRQRAAALVNDAETSYIQKLVRRLPVADSNVAPEARLAGYLSLLDRVLEDRVIEDSEAENLLALAAEWGLTVEDAKAAHRHYLRMLCSAALEDGVVTASERADLESVCRLLGIDQKSLDSMLQAYESPPSEASLPHQAPSAGELAGACVCFTGEFAGPRGGGMTRHEAADLAERHGITVFPTLTKKVNILVVADPETQSGKAVTARRRGTRIMAEAVFWRMIGVN